MLLEYELNVTNKAAKCKDICFIISSYDIIILKQCMIILGCEIMSGYDVIRLLIRDIFYYKHDGIILQ